MREDSLLRWIVESRNKIVKQGDLTTFSESYVSVIRDYYDEAKILKKELDSWNSLPNISIVENKDEREAKPVEMPLHEIVESLHLEHLPLSIQQRITIYLERQWVEESLPEYEILTVLTYCYSQLRLLIIRAHQITLEQEKDCTDTFENTKCKSYKDIESDGRLPCMTSTRGFRSTRRRYFDGSEVTEYRNVPAVIDSKVALEVAMSGKYGTLPKFPYEKIGTAQKPEQLRTLLSVYSEIAKGILLSGEDHGWFSHYFRSGIQVDTRIHMTLDAQGKRAIAAEIAYTAMRCSADTVVMINETWVSEFRTTRDGALYPASLDPERKEGVQLSALSRSGAYAMMFLPFEVVSESGGFREVRLEKETGVSIEQDLFFAPLSEVWNLRKKPLKGEAFWRAQQAAKDNNSRPSTD
ncbi:hypothetical protein C5L39_09730 [Corynebacterium alimapuense]|uniref:Uncharacterized protein n=2 Tax=Corynebacterium alimapuense TaxID=1576874 RepID=A0A3M8K4L5_9CORY|nr:hypothetical protein C5L39_09730 [Corynebacterium alimapuense]